MSADLSQRRIEKIISGGQTGVDRAALDFAIELGIPHGGWCPKGRMAEDGVLPEVYNLRETKSEDVAVRTRRNVRDADGTLIISKLPLTGGTALTEKIAVKRGRPAMIFSPDEHRDADAIIAWLDAHNVKKLNVAGPRESESPGIYSITLAILLAAFGNRS